MSLHAGEAFHVREYRPSGTHADCRTSLVTRLLVGVSAFVLVFIIPWLLFLRRWGRTWGATDAEVDETLPGDELATRPLLSVSTRAVTINAPPTAVWPWLVQMGHKRAGFYTHNSVEKLLLSGIPDVHEIHPEWQDLEVGDITRTNRDIQKGHPIGWPVAMGIPTRAVVVRSMSLPVWTYAYVLIPISRETTRLISRDRAIWLWRETPFRLLIFEPLHNYMQTGVLQGIKQRAERVRLPAIA